MHYKHRVSGSTKLRNWSQHTFPISLQFSKLLQFRPKMTYHLCLACYRGRLVIRYFQPGVSLLRRFTPGYKYVATTRLDL